MENKTGINGAVIGKTIGFGALSLLMMLTSSIISDKFIANGTEVVNGITDKIMGKKEDK